MIFETKNTDKEPVIQTDVVTRQEAVQNNLGPEVQNMLPITDINEAPQGKESKLLSESNKLHGSQKAVMSDMKDEVQAIQKEEDPRGHQNEGSHHQAACPGHSSSLQVTNRLKGRGLRPASQWSHCLAWTLCLLSTLSCLVLSAALGTR